MEENHPSFFKVMIGHFKSTLRIPPMFKRHLSKKVMKYSVLRVPGGRQWKVKMGVEHGEVYFRDGWESFVCDCNISRGDFLVFFYDGNVGFDLKLYDKTCCEKEGCPPPPIVVKVEPESESQDSDDGEPAENASLKINRKRKPDLRDSIEQRSPAKMSKLCYKVLKGAKPADNAMAMEAACSLKPPNPHFVTTCRKSRAAYMTIPTELVKKFDLDQKESIILRDPCNGSWSVKLSVWRDGRRCFSTGWSSFYRKKHLKEGDVCVFEFLQGGDIVNAHIFRAGECEGKSIPKSGAKSTQESGKELFQDERSSTEDNKEKVMHAAEPSGSNNLEFTIVWKSTRLYHVRIPKKVAKGAGLDSNRLATLINPSGNSWPINITVRSHGEVELGIGWSQFSRGNNLAYGDVCTFEFVGGADTIKVRIVRAAQAGTSAAPSGPVSPKLEMSSS